ncbi:MAG: DUF6788 family protein [Solirubrobacterales bacterium]
MPTATDVPARVRALAAQLAEPKPMRRGSLSERYVKCNKPGCPCAERPEARHGPYYSLSRVVKGRTQSRWVAAEQAALVRRQVEAGQRFRNQLEAYWAVCEAWATAQVLTPPAASPEAAQKGGSRRAWRPKLPRKSKRS